MCLLLASDSFLIFFFFFLLPYPSICRDCVESVASSSANISAEESDLVIHVFGSVQSYRRNSVVYLCSSSCCFSKNEKNLVICFPGSSTLKSLPSQYWNSRFGLSNLYMGKF